MMNPNRRASRHQKFEKSRQRLGQYFLASRPVLETIARATDDLRALPVLEIGPGRGALTFLLAGRFPKVIAVEKDERLADELENALRERNIKTVSVARGDILELFPNHLALPERYAVIANIPYSLTSRLIRVLLESGRRPEAMALMVQEEVAERIVATPPRMSILSIAVQAYATPRIIARVPRTAFSPQPKVDSALIRIDRISDAFFRREDIAPDVFFKILRAAFGGKRKVLVNTLAPLAGSKTKASAAIAAAAIAPTARPEMLSLPDWVRLLRALSAGSNLHGSENGEQK